MKKVIFAAMAAAALAMPSCSSDEVVDVKNNDVISFNVTAGKASRGNDATTTASLNQFKMYASVKGQLGSWFFDGLVVNKAGGKWSYGYERFWPETAVDFFCVAPANVSVNAATVGSMSIENYVVGDNADVDLLYAYNKEETKDAHKSGSDVHINFRHALSQIVFRAANTNANYKFELSKIQLTKLVNKGTLAWATESTNSPDRSEGQEGNNLDTELDDGSWAKWTVSAEAADVTSYTYTPASTWVGDGVAAASDVTGANEALFLLPQTITSWNMAANTGSELIVTVKVTDRTSNVVVYEGDARVALVAPNGAKEGTDGWVDNKGKWMQGKKYIYTLNFGSGAGFEPEGPNPKPVLVPITVNITVDEFQNGGEYNPVMTNN